MLILPRRRALITSVAALTTAMGPQQRRAAVGNANGNLKSGLVGQWEFEEGVGANTRDRSPLGNVGNFVGTPSPTWVVGKFGNGLSFNAAQYVKVKSGPILSGLNAWTISSWVNVNSSPSASGSAIYSERAPSGNDIVKLEGFYTSVNSIWLTIRNDAGVLTQVQGTKSVNDGKWHHICGVFTGSVGTNVFIYIDGILNISGSFSGTSTYTNSGIISCIAADVTGSEFFSGTIDSVRLYSRALSASEIAQLYRMYPDEGQ